MQASVRVMVVLGLLALAGLGWALWEVVRLFFWAALVTALLFPMVRRLDCWLGRSLAVTLVMVAGPILMMLLGLWAARSFRLNAASHWVLVNEVERLRQGATEAESPASKRIVEELTGWRYEDLWGRGGKNRRPPEKHYD
jgi:predicted PurR-regulated permease PerM